MKLLLTSSGLTNQSIVTALFELTAKKPEETTIVFIPTASMVETGDKKWLIEDLIKLKKLNFKSIEITDISAVDEKIWKPSVERADVLFFEGGNTFHLMRWLNTSGLAQSLQDLLREKVYVGVSAVSMVTGPDLALRISQEIFEEDMSETEEMNGLNLVDFYVLPHFQSEHFKKVRRELIEKAAENIHKPIFVLDDDSALIVVDDTIEVISEGEWFDINNT